MKRVRKWAPWHQGMLLGRVAGLAFSTARAAQPGMTPALQALLAKMGLRIGR